MQKQLPKYFTEPEGSLDFVDLKLKNSLPKRISVVASCSKTKKISSLEQIDPLHPPTEPYDTGFKSVCSGEGG